MRFGTILTSCIAFLLCMPVAAVTLRVATAGDLISMDPQVGDAMQLGFSSNIYEALVARDKQMNVVPGLATQWTRMTPTTWRFKLREGVSFHDGTRFTADDVVFSFDRANSPGSERKAEWFKKARRIDDATVDIDTHEPYPILPETLTTYFIMSRKWCEENNARLPADRSQGTDNRASYLTNGTGPFRLKERQPSLRTVLVRNSGYWKQVESNLDEVVVLSIGNEGTRVAALLSGGVDLIEPAPLKDVDRIRAAGMTVLQGPEPRTIFLGMDVRRDELLSGNIKGRNPFKDKRVRRAVYQAIDIEAIRSQIMRGAATPTALMVGPGVRGFQSDMNMRLPYDPETARKLLAESGYPQGFEVDLNCPNDRYVNDAAICQAVAAQLARIGIAIVLRIEPKSIYGPKILRGQLSFFLLGWSPSTLDAQQTLEAVMSTPDGTFQGRANSGGYSNPRVDELTRKIRAELDDGQRNAMIREAFRIHQDEIGHIPLHQQALAWAFSRRVRLAQTPDNAMRFMWMSLLDE